MNKMDVSVRTMMYLGYLSKYVECEDIVKQKFLMKNHYLPKAPTTVFAYPGNSMKKGAE